jgi:hypothetical protein
MANGTSAVADAKDYQNVDIEGWSQDSYNIGITKYYGIQMDVALP